MTRKRKRTISLGVVVVLAAALGGLYFWQSRQEPYVPELPPVLSSTLIQRAEADVARVTFHHDTGESYAMAPTRNPQGGTLWHWEPAPDYILVPNRARDKVRQAWQLTATETVHTETQGLDLTLFGLNPPRLTMAVAYEDGTSKNIYIGSHTIDMRHVFVMVEGDEAMHIAPAVWADRATGSIEDLLDMELHPMTMHVDYLYINQRDTPPIQVAMSYGHGILDESMALSMLAMPEFRMMRMQQPLLGRGIDEGRFELFVIDPLTDFQLQGVVTMSPVSLAPYGLDEPELELIFQDPWGENHLLFGNRFFIEDVEYIYVKFYDRPHIFKALFEEASVMFNLNIFMFIERFLALVDIRDVDSITIESPDESRNFHLTLNHYDEFGIAPTVNGMNVPEDAFRVAYRLLVGLSADNDVEPTTPEGEPAVTITYHRITHEDTQLRLFPRGGNFYGVSINGSDIWFVTNARDVGIMFDQLDSMIEITMPGHISGLLE